MSSQALYLDHVTGQRKELKEFIGSKFNRLTVIDDAGHATRLTKKGERVKADKLVLCRCDCGEERVVRLRHLTAGATQSCGCLNAEKSSKYLRDHPLVTRLSPGESAKRSLYATYASKAIYRGLEFSIPLDEFTALTKGDCYYCGVSPKQRKSKYTPTGDYVYNGIDRVDSSLGYVAGNNVSCCIDCNRAKNAMSLEAFKGWIRRIYGQLQEGKF